MAISGLPASPAGEISHGTVREKVNELVAHANSNTLTSSSKSINSRADCPNLVGNVSTLEPNVAYKIASGYTDNVEFVASEGAQIEGDGVFSEGYIYTGVGVPISSTDVGFSIRDFAITAPLASQVLNCSGSFLNALFADAFRIYDSSKLGTFDGMAPVFNNFSGTRFNDGFSFTGAPIIGFSFVNAFMQDVNASAVHFDFDDAVFLQLALRGVEMDGTGTAFSSSVGGEANLAATTDAIVSDCTFGVTGAMTSLSGFDNDFQTVGWEFSRNSPTQIVEDTGETADQFLLTPNTISVSNADTFYEIGVPSAGSWDSDIANRFTPNADGSVTYKGHKNIFIDVTIISSVEKSGGGSDLIESRIGLDWTAGNTGIEKSKSNTQNSAPTTIISKAELEIAPDQDIRAIYSINSTSDIIVDNVSMNIKRVR